MNVSEDSIKLAVVILNWNGKDFLSRFLPSVLEYCPEYATVFVADNGSHDNSLPFLENNFPEIERLKLGQNYGYTGGYNRALKQINAEYFILLNSDIEASPGWIPPIIEYMDNNPDIAACQPKILSWHNRNQFEYAGACGGFIDHYGYPFCRGRVFHFLEDDNGQYDDTLDIFWATGACMVVRATDFFAAGALDDDFFAHMEEIDLCWRLKRMGKRIVCLPQSKVFHVGGGTLPANSPRKTYLNFRNNLLLLAKNLQTQRFYTVMIIRFLLDQLAALKFLLSGQPRDFFAVARAWFSLMRMLRRKRREGKKFPWAKVSGVYRQSLVKEFFLYGKKMFNHLHHSSFGKM